MRILLALASALLVLALLCAGAVWSLDHWSPFQGTPDQVSARFLADLPPAPPGPAAQGRALVAAAGCARCHTADLGGGPEFSGPFGLVKSANLTPSVSGLLHETDANLLRALRSGLDEDGSPMPERAMPWDQVGHLSNAELASVIAYLHQLPPVNRGNGHLHRVPRPPGAVHQPLPLPR